MARQAILGGFDTNPVFLNETQGGDTILSSGIFANVPDTGSGIQAVKKWIPRGLLIRIIPVAISMGASLATLLWL